MRSSSEEDRNKGLAVKRVKQVKNQTLFNQRQKQITEAALSLFLEKGYHATTIRDISRRSGVNKGSLYDYVQNKEDILRILMDKMHQTSEVFPREKQQFQERFGSLKEYLKSQFKYSWTENRQGILLTYRVTKSLKREALKNLLTSDSALVDRIVDRIKLFTGIEDDDKRIRLIANVVVFLNAFMPMRDWSLREYDMDDILDLVVEMVLKVLEVDDPS
ncbi:TetR/AcrR family transcriptional regulator [bacterium]|nr:TetR/AcrR family transcriptional regulator [bacterium]